MKNSFKECLLMAAGALLSAACDEKDLVCDPEPPVTVTVVTEELAAWTIKRDSFPSSTPCRLLAGQVDDATSGKTTVCPYFVLSSPRSDGLWAGCEYDSVTFFARSDQTVWGDPNPLQTFHLYRLNKLLPTAPVFSNATFGHEAEPLGTMVLYPGEGRVFDLRCRLSDAFGRELFGMLLEGSDVLKDADLFRDYFRGVALFPDPLNTLIMGLDPSQGGVGITVHYHDGDASGGCTFATGAAKDIPYMFINLTNNPAGTPYYALGQQSDRLPFEAVKREETPDGQVLVFGMGGYMARIELPAELPGWSEECTLERVEIGWHAWHHRVPPRPGDGWWSTASYPLPAAVRLYETDGDNRVLAEVTDAAGMPVEAVLTDADSGTYCADITHYYRSRLQRQGHAPSGAECGGEDAGVPLALLAGVPVSELPASSGRLVIDMLPRIRVHWHLPAQE